MVLSIRTPCRIYNMHPYLVKLLAISDQVINRFHAYSTRASAVRSTTTASKKISQPQQMVKLRIYSRCRLTLKIYGVWHDCLSSQPRRLEGADVEFDA